MNSPTTRNAVLSCLFVVAAAGFWPCQSRAQDVTETLINPYYLCVGKATGRQPDRFANPGGAIERAFVDCRTEEMAIRSWGEMGDLSPAQVNAIVAVQQGRLKRYLSEQLEAAPPAPKKKK